MTVNNDDDKNKNDGGGEPMELNERLEKSEKEKAEYLAGWQRAKADFINYKKDEYKRLEEVARYGSEDLIMDLISILDSFDLALNATERQKLSAPTPEGGRSSDRSVGMERGIYMIRAQIYDLLKKRGVEKIIVRPGDKFDPAVAEVIAETESDEPAGAILEEIEPGYKLYDKILRPARVKIAKKTSLE